MSTQRRTMAALWRIHTAADRRGSCWLAGVAHCATGRIVSATISFGVRLCSVGLLSTSSSCENDCASDVKLTAAAADAPAAADAEAEAEAASRASVAAFRARAVMAGLAAAAAAAGDGDAASASAPPKENDMTTGELWA